jgi:hypothetical protein
MLLERPTSSAASSAAIERIPQALVANSSRSGAAGDSHSRTAPSIGFSAHRALERSADDYAADPAFNPRQVVLSADARAALEQFLSEARAQRAELLRMRFSLAREHALAKSARGEFETYEQRALARGKGAIGIAKGKIQVVLHQPGETSKVVSVGLGENEPLDQCEAQLQQFEHDAHSQIRLFFP